MIKINRLGKPNYGELSDLEEIIHSFRKSNAIHNEKLNDAFNVIQDVVNRDKKSLLSNKEERIKLWKSLIEHYISINDIESQRQYYAFPYSYIEGNNCIAMLVVECNSNYKSGIEDSVLHIFKELNHDMTIDEITEEEFLHMAHKRAEEVLNYRKHRIEMHKNDMFPTYNIKIINN